MTSFWEQMSIDMYAAVIQHLPDNSCHPECEPHCPSN